MMSLQMNSLFTLPTTWQSGHCHQIPVCVWKKGKPTIHSFIHSLSVTTCPLQGPRRTGANLSWHYVRAGYTLDKLPGHHAADIQRQPFTLTFTPMDNLQSSNKPTCMSLNCRRKPENLEGTPTDTGKTWKLHTERSYPSRVLNPGHSSLTKLLQMCRKCQ